MNYPKYLRRAGLTVIFVLAAHFTSMAQTEPPELKIQFTVVREKNTAGRQAQGVVTLEIPAGYHVNAHNPRNRFALPTILRITAPRGIRIGAVAYPRGTVRRFSFSEDRLGVYEGRVVLRFNITQSTRPAAGNHSIKARLNFQSCSDAACFPPRTEELSATLTNK